MNTVKLIAWLVLPIAGLVALGAIAGPPISGAINGATGGFVFTGVYAGAQKSSLSPLLPSAPANGAIHDPLPIRRAERPAP